MEKYKPIKHLGEGSFGTVLLVQNDKGLKYALKKTKINCFSTEDSLKQIKVIQKLIHPNLIRVYGFYQSPEADELEIVMQYCEGGDLLRYYSDNNKSLKPHQILNIFRQIVKAFIALNVKGIMHRDLKPENVLLKYEMTGIIVKIADFGCARNLAPDQISKIENFTSEKGTIIYASPQQLHNENYSSKCDVWAGGCLLYLLTYGYHPFKDTTIQKTISKIKALTYNKEIALPANSDPTIREIIKLMLIYEDNERANWRELWLHRFFNPKVSDMPNFIQYLRSISNIANWIIKEFWRLRKSMNIESTKNETFAYYIIKFQYTNIIMAQQITQLKPCYEYLFLEGAYRPLKGQHKQLLGELSSEVESYKSYFEKIKQTLTNKSKDKKDQSDKKQMQRKSCYSDLEHSIREAHKILIQVLPQLEKIARQGKESIDLVWLIMARWLNFQFWFSYEKKPRVQNFLKESIPNKNILKQIQVELEKYNYGVVE